LDSERLLGLIGEVTTQSVQLVVTSLSSNFDAFGMPGRRYVISAGTVERVG
jgi:hypothetical protein